MDKLSKQVIKRISRIENVQVDALVGIAAILSIKKAVLVSVHLQTTSSIAVAPVYNTSETSVGWIHEIETYLQTGDLPEESKRAHKIRVQATRFTLIEDNLYKRSFGGLYLKYLNNAEA